MSGPYRFTQDSRSPLDRQPANLYPQGQAPSFKTNINRMKTKKWVEAKKTNYDGDDWGDYDEYDEYGTEEPLPPPPPAQDSYRPRVGESSRSFTDPMRQGPPQPARRNSFDTGDETRAFTSAAYPQTAAGEGYNQPSQQLQQQGSSAPTSATDSRQPATRQASAAESDVSDTPQHRRDFSPSALPPPLQTRMSPPPGNTTGSPASQFPPRKSSISQVESPSGMSPRDSAPSNTSKPLPFIRPADIYKRAEEERQRQSIDSSRPSIDSLSGRPKMEPQSPKDFGNTEAGVDTKAPQSLDTVVEKKDEYAKASSPQLTLPPVQDLSPFDNDFWSGNAQSLHTAAQHPGLSPSDNIGLRSVVDQAFTRRDDTTSVPPTPISKDSDDMVSRSNTNSTAGISPIMSRVPSTATSMLKNRSAADGSTPVIAEETENTPVSRPTSAVMLGGPYQVARKPSPSHSRNPSNTTLPRTGVSTPSRGESPARAPAIEHRQPTRDPEVAQLSSTQSTPEDMEGGLEGPSAAYADREADFATAMNSHPEQAASGFGEASKKSQDAFLNSHHNASSPINEALPRSRSESPSKGRVQELAGKFGDVSHSRRGSTQSNASRTSVQSWERSQDNSRAPSPTKLDPVADRPVAGRETSFRPQLPGQWESYATTAQTPADEDAPANATSNEKGALVENNAVTSPLGDVDFTPTTSKHQVSKPESDNTASNPLTALKAAGTAIGDAIQASIGSTETQLENKEGQEQVRAIGNIYPSRPVLDRAVSSAYSSIPPTPPEKDAENVEELRPPPPLKDKSPEPRSPVGSEAVATRPTIMPQLSVDANENDQESDRLRKEIVASLSPLKQAETADLEPTQMSLQPAVQNMTSRESSILDSYLAEDDHGSPQPTSENKPSLLTRFSWEERPSHLVSPDGQAQPGATAPTSGQPAIKPPVEQQTGNRESAQSFQSTPSIDIGTGSASVTQPQSGNAMESNVSAPMSPVEPAKGGLSPPLEQREPEPEPEPERMASPVSGLHVVNSAVNPEAVDLPPRFNADVSPISQPSQQQGNQEAASATQPKQDSNDTAAPKSPVGPTSPNSAGGSATKSPTSDKPLGFRDIANIKSSSERIMTYDRTRDYWANADHGLGDWIASAMTTNPELASQPLPQPRPYLAGSASSRHKASGSLSLFGKHHGSTNSQAQNTPYYEQYNSAASQVSAPNASSGETRPPGPSSGAPGSRITSQQMQARGKDLLHSAGVLGGKGMTGAKGLFAKGKSRFKASGSGDKVDK